MKQQVIIMRQNVKIWIKKKQNHDIKCYDTF